jgi:hypothetical protein
LILVLLLIGILASVFDVKLVKSTEDNWWDSNWMYRRQVNITENSGYSLTNFPVELSFRHDGHAQPDGRDIRVVDSLIEIPSYVEECNSTYAKVVFEINLTALETKTIYIYYGNPNATTPNYPLVPLTISEGNNGYAIIDNLVYLEWKYTKWGWDGDNNKVVLWTGYKIDFDGNGNPNDDYDLITDVSGRIGGIGRYRIDYGNAVVRSFGLGDYQGFNQTPVYIDINFENATLRVCRKNTYVQTVQVDKLLMFGHSWDYAKHKDGIEENIIDGLNTNAPQLFHVLYNSSTNPGWMAYRNSFTGTIIAGLGFDIREDYSYLFNAKETGDWDRGIHFDKTFPVYLDPHDQPPKCRIYWYGDDTNEYTNIEKMATILGNLPSITIADEETPTLTIASTISINPQTLNIKSKGKWIISYLELPEEYDAKDINVPSIMLNDTIPVEPNSTAIGDYDNDTIPDLMVKFNRTVVSEFILSKGIVYGNVTLTLTGQLYNGTIFAGSDMILVSALVGDVNVDGYVGIDDIQTATESFGSNPNHPRWNPNANFTPDYYIGIDDMCLIAKNFGETYT